MKKLLAIFLELGTAYNLPTDSLDALKAELAKDNADDIDASSISDILKKGLTGKLDAVSRNAAFDKKKQDELYKSAERKIKGEVEKLIKEKFNVDTDAESLEDLVEEALANVNTKTTKGKELTDDAVKAHPLYVQLEKQAKADLKKANDAKDAAVLEVTNKYEGEKVFGKVSNKALEYFQGKKPVLSTDAEKAKNQMKQVERLLSDYQFQDVDGTIVITDKDGKVLEDELKNKLTLEKLVDSITEPLFDFQVAEPRTSPNGSQGTPGTGTATNQGMKYTGQLPKTQKELSALLVDENIPVAERIEVQAWAESNPTAIAAN